MTKQTNETWQETLQKGDQDAFHRLVDPQVDALLRAARHDLAYYIAQGHLHADDLSPEEVVGETQLHAWSHRERCPQRMSLRGWLLGVQHRLLRGLVAQQRAYRADKAISLDERVPINRAALDTQETFWDWYQPDVEILWEDVIPGVEPVDIEIDLDKDGRDALLPLDESARHVLVMHDEFEVPLPEVAFIMGRSVNEIAGMLATARTDLRERLVGEAPMGEDDQPPPTGRDA